MALSQRYVRSTPFEDFDPNEGNDERPLWAIYYPYTFKTYAQRGHAISAFSNHNQCKLYRHDEGRWVEVAAKDEYNRPQVCDCCGCTTMGYPRRWDHHQRRTVENSAAGRTFNYGRYQWDRNGRKLAEPLKLRFLCEGCR